MRVLVTGATGFVGSHLVEALVQRGHEVKVLARRTSDQRWLRGIPLTWCWGDLGVPLSLQEALQEVDWVFHVAGVTKALGYAAYMAVNARGTRHLMEACLREGEPPSRVVLVSSLAASGPCGLNEAKRESDPCLPVSHYGISKFEGERIALSYADRVSLVMVRPPVVYGPRDRDVLTFFRMIKGGWNLTLGGGERYLCMLHVEDLVQGVLLAAEAQVSSGSTFFLSDGQVHSWTEMADLLQGIVGTQVRSLRIPVRVAWVAALASELVSALRGTPPLFNREKLREMLQQAWTCEIQSAVETLGFSPQIPLEKGLRETYRWYREQGWI
jgi:dihydroflavonol-4-reductase